MNEELQQALADIILRATETAGAAKDFVLAEMPDVIQQLLMWKLAESLLYFVLAGSAAYLAFRWVKGAIQDRRTAIEAARKAYADKESWTRFSGYSDVTSGTYDFTVIIGDTRSVLGFIGGLVATIVAFACVNFTWLQILIAPKIYLIEYAASLVK